MKGGYGLLSGIAGATEPVAWASVRVMTLRSTIVRDNGMGPVDHGGCFFEFRVDGLW